MTKRVVIAVLGGWLLALVVQPRDLLARFRG